MLTKDDLKEIKKLLSPIEEDLSDVKNRVKRIEKTNDTIIDVFDRADVDLKKRMTKVEKHLGIAED